MDEPIGTGGGLDSGCMGWARPMRLNSLGRNRPVLVAQQKSLATCATCATCATGASLLRATRTTSCSSPEYRPEHCAFTPAKLGAAR